MAYEIYISDYNNTKVLQLPIVPSEFPSLSSDGSNETFETYWNGTFNFIEKEGLQQFTLESWLPRNASKYHFCKSRVNAKEIIDLINTAKKNTEPIKIVMNDKDGYYVNDTFSIEKFEYSIMRREDYKYTLAVKQWREYNQTITNTSTTTGWQQDNTGWWYVYDDAGNYYKGSWQMINNEWYSFQPNGYILQSSWLQDGGYWYYLKDSGAMAVNEWLQYNGKWYYLGSDGAMWAGGTANIDGIDYTFNDDGSLVE